MGRGHEQTFLQRRHPDGQQTHEKNAPYHSASEKYKSKLQWDTTSHQSVWLKLTSQGVTEAGKDAEKGEPFYAAGGNASWCNHSGKQHGSSSKSWKIELPYDPAIALLGIYPKDTNVVIWRATCTWMFTAAMTIAKPWKEPRCLSTDEWIKKMWYI